MPPATCIVWLCAKMNLIESLLMWASSLSPWLEGQGVELASGSSPTDVPRRSAWVNLRRGDREAELILWQSGEAEFSAFDPNDGVTQQHYEIENPDRLASVLLRLLESIT
jgi:hypothetical protein